MTNFFSLITFVNGQCYRYATIQQMANGSFRAVNGNRVIASNLTYLDIKYV